LTKQRRAFNIRPTVAEPGQETVGQRIRRLRLERRLSQRELESPGVSYAYISRIEGGQRQPSLKALRHLAQRLGVSAEYLETGDPIPALARLELQLSDAELLLRLGSEPERAEVMFADVLAEARELMEPALAARARAGIGLLAAHRSANNDAIQHLEQATGSGYVPPQARPDIYQALGGAYMATGAMERAAELWESVLERLRADDPNDPALLIRFDSYLSWAYSELGRMESARSALDEATEIAEDPSVAPQVRVSAYWELARRSWNEDEDASAALAHMRRAVGLLAASEDTYQLARAHLLCAQLLNFDGRPDAAARHLARAEPLLVRAGERSELGVLRAEQAKEAAHRDDAERALELATEAERLLGDDARHVGLREHALGVAHAANGEIDKASRHFEHAVSDLAERQQWREATAVEREWAKLLRGAGRQEEALEAFERAMQLTERSRPRAEPRT
jgi:transcriptional regulator with XRE-family HTH domain